ncbi:MAG: hypothetical protein Q8P41_25950 [Pseudomonadota bacterium]|nr:hypothetical protein [Pseudomonadota bacterium]
MASRSTPHRYLGVLVRTAHLAGVVGVFAAAWRGAPVGLWADLVLLTGAALVADELWRFGLDWLRWTQAWVLLLKLAAFGVLYAADQPVAGLWVAFVLGSFIAHAPGELRHAPIVGASGPCARPKGALTSRPPAPLPGGSR